MAGEEHERAPCLPTAHRTQPQLQTAANPCTLQQQGDLAALCNPNVWGPQQQAGKGVASTRVGLLHPSQRAAARVRGVARRGSVQPVPTTGSIHRPSVAQCGFVCTLDPTRSAGSRLATIPGPPPRPCKAAGLEPEPAPQQASGAEAGLPCLPQRRRLVSNNPPQGHDPDRRQKTQASCMPSLDVHNTKQAVDAPRAGLGLHGGRGMAGGRSSGSSLLAMPTSP